MQFPEDVAAAPFRIDNQPRQDLLPLPIKGVFPGTSPAQYLFSPHLLSVPSLEHCCQIGDAPNRQEYFLLYNVPLKRYEEVQEECLKRKVGNSQHSERWPVVIARFVGRGGWGQALEPLRSVLAASGQI